MSVSDKKKNLHEAACAGKLISYPGLFLMGTYTSLPLKFKFIILIVEREFFRAEICEGQSSLPIYLPSFVFNIFSLTQALSSFL